MLSLGEERLLKISAPVIKDKYDTYKLVDKFLVVPINIDERAEYVEFQDISFRDNDELKYKLSLMFSGSVAQNVFDMFQNKDGNNLITINTKMALVCNYNPVHSRDAGVKLVILSDSYEISKF